MAKYGSRGKYWNVGLSDHSRLSATMAQLVYLKRLTRKDWFGKGLTRGEAGDMIDKALAEIERKNDSKNLSHMADAVFNSLFRKAVNAANEAGDEWSRQNREPLFQVTDKETGETIACYGPIGNAWLTWPKSGTDFHRWLIDNVYEGDKLSINIPHQYTDRLEVGLKFACERAALTVFKQSGTDLGDIRLMVRCEEDQLPQAA